MSPEHWHAAWHARFRYIVAEGANGPFVRLLPAPSECFARTVLGMFKSRRAAFDYAFGDVNMVACGDEDRAQDSLESRYDRYDDE